MKITTITTTVKITTTITTVAEITAITTTVKIMGKKTTTIITAVKIEKIAVIMNVTSRIITPSANWALLGCTFIACLIISYSHKRYLCVGERGS